jgi:type I restriction enzyme S subunit
LGDIETLVPPLSEQKQISNYLDQETGKIDRTIDTETKRSNLLKEYRQSLISNVVTGKIDVRDEVIQ